MENLLRVATDLQKHLESYDKLKDGVDLKDWIVEVLDLLPEAITALKVPYMVKDTVKKYGLAYVIVNEKGYKILNPSQIIITYMDRK